MKLCKEDVVPVCMDGGVRVVCPRQAQSRHGRFASFFFVLCSALAVIRSSCDVRDFSSYAQGQARQVLCRGGSSLVSIANVTRLTLLPDSATSLMIPLLQAPAKVSSHASKRRGSGFFDAVRRRTPWCWLWPRRRAVWWCGRRSTRSWMRTSCGDGPTIDDAAW